MQNFGKRIAALRTDAHMTQAELAEKLNITDRAVSKWETGASYPDITLLPMLADLFRVSTDYLLRGTPKVLQKLKQITAFDQKYIQHFNEKYLENGWQIKHLEAAGSGGVDGYCCAFLVIEKLAYEPKILPPSNAEA